MLLARLNRWLRPALTLLALAGTLALTACGGGSGSINNPTQPTPTPISVLSTLPAGVIIAYSGVPTTIKIVGGLPPYQALSNNSAVLPVPLNVSGDTVVLVANPVALGVDVPVAITISDQSGQATVVSVTVRFAPLFATGLTVTPSSGLCGQNVCDGDTAAVTAVATGPGGAPLPGRQIRFDVVFGGSTWCLDRMRERGITNVRLLMQGIDREIFRSLPRERDGAFRVFSGGKFEWRKGQDLVIAAFAAFAKAHPEANAHLVCAWFNPWGELIWEMGNSPYLLFEGVDGDDQPKLFSKLLTVNGVPEGQFTMLPQLAQRDLAREMAGTDCGLFPNRCEGGTNLVLMEYLGCGRPAVANLATGHADLAGADIIPIPTTLDDRQWAVQDPADVLRALETAYARFRVGELVARSATPGSWTWERAARTIVEALGELDAASVKRASAAS